MFHSPQVKWNLISTIRNLMYEILHELPNGLRPRIVGNEEMLAKRQNCMGTQSGL